MHTQHMAVLKKIKTKTLRLSPRTRLTDCSQILETHMSHHLTANTLDHRMKAFLPSTETNRTTLRSHHLREW